MDYTKQLEEVKKLDNQEQEKALALAIHLELEPGENDTLDSFLSQFSSSDAFPELFTIGKQEYLVLTDSEADEKHEEELDHYIDEIILPEIPEAFRYYFDNEKWKHDARMDGRGHSLSSYDGNEYDEEVNGTTYYIYRTN